MDQPTATFANWCVVELFGHQREAGFVTTQYFGDKAMFQLDVPALEEREIVTTRPQWIGDTMCAVGTRYTKSAVAGRTRLINPGAVYALNPCSKEAALNVLEDLAPREIKIVELAKKQQIPQGNIVECDSCGASAPEGTPIAHAPGCENVDITGVDIAEEETIG